MHRSPTMSRPLLAMALVVATWVGVSPPAQAATVTSVVFDNVSGATELGSDPASWAQVDDLRVDSGGVLFLPASAEIAELQGWAVLDDGTYEPFGPADYTVSPRAADGSHRLTLNRADGQVLVTVHQSADVPAVYITTGSGLPAIEADKDFKDTGATMALVDAGASTAYNGPLSEMKGRGNSTWSYPKKPYQIKLSTTTELVPDAGGHKTWLLLANYLDASLVRNRLAYDLEGSSLRRAGAADFSIKGRPVDLFVDGGFRGSYYLTEKVQVGATRVAIGDLQKANEEANPDLSSYTPVTTTALDGAPGLREARYVPFPTTPSGYQRSGYLLEMDFLSRARQEASYVVTRNGVPFVLKGPEEANAAEVAFVGNRLQKLEEAIFAPDGRNSDGVHFSRLLDVPSWARYYLVQELVANDDAYKSSTFVHLDQGGRLVAGPLWDADRSLGALSASPAAGRVHVGDPARLKPRWINELLSHESFRTAVQQQYSSVVAPEVRDILAPGQGRLARYAAEVARSAALDKLRWAPHDASVWHPTPAQDVAHLRDYLSRRSSALGAVVTGNYVAGAMLPDGYYTIGNRALTVDVRKASWADRADVNLWTPNRTGAQTFRVARGTDGYYTITNANSTKVLDVVGGAAANGTDIQQHTANGTLGQKWRVTTYDGQNYTLASAVGTSAVLRSGGPENGYVLDAQSAGTAPGTNLHIYRSNGTVAQRFALTRVSLPAPADGTAYTVVSKVDTRKAMDVKSASPADRANIQLWRRNGTPAQRFTVRALSNGAVELWTGTRTNGVVDVAGGGTARGTNVQQYRHNGTPAQQWFVRPTGDLDGSSYLVSRVNGLYLDVAGASSADGTNIQVWTGNGTKAQKFQFVRSG